MTPNWTKEKKTILVVQDSRPKISAVLIRVVLRLHLLFWVYKWVLTDKYASQGASTVVLTRRHCRLLRFEQYCTFACSFFSPSDYSFKTWFSKLAINQTHKIPTEMIRLHKRLSWAPVETLVMTQSFFFPQHREYESQMSCNFKLISHISSTCVTS